MRFSVRMIFFGLALLAAGGLWLARAERSAEPLAFTAPMVSLVGAASAQTSQGDDAGTSPEAAEAPAIPDMVLGEADAPVTIVEYASYTCPHCRRFHEGPFKQLKADFIDTGKARLIYREFYFDKYGLWASLLARCGGPEKFFGITELLYRGQDTWARAGSDAAIADELRKIGRLAGMSVEQIESCLTDSDKIRALVKWFQDNATRDGIDSTPSFVINGRKYQNMPYPEMKAIIENELKG